MQGYVKVRRSVWFFKKRLMTLLEDGTIIRQKDDGTCKYDLKITDKTDILVMKGKRFSIKT